MSNPNLSKAEEIAVLEKAIAKLGPDSYLGPWLGEIKAQVEGFIRADIFPMVCLNACAKDVQETQANAKRRADEIIRVAEQKAEAIRVESRRHREAVASQLRNVLRTLEN